MYGFLIDLLGTLLGLAIVAALIVFGVLIIILLLKMVVILLPAALVALAVWLLTGDLSLAAVAFLAVALISLVKLL